MKILTRGNSKLARSTGIFSQPAKKTCPMAGECKKICYAGKGVYTWPVVANKRKNNFKLSLKKDFVANILQDMATTKLMKKVRIHDSGDFYHQDYLNKWIEVANKRKDLLFYGYTKSLHLDFSKLPRNFIIIQSYGGKLDHLIDDTKRHAKIFKTKEELLLAGYIDASENDDVFLITNKIGLIEH